jgi:hypothetical protein
MFHRLNIHYKFFREVKHNNVRRGLMEKLRDGDEGVA